MKKDYHPLAQAAYDAATRNRSLIEKSEICGCYSCCRTFPASEVTSYVSSEEPTAECPYCFSDSVIPDAAGLPLTKDFLEAMRKQWLY